MSVSASPSPAANRPLSSSGAFAAPSSAQLGRSLGRAALAVLCAASLGACATLVPTITPLPEMNEAAALRDQVARHEAASVERATQLSSKASACGDCQSASSALVEGAQARLETIGGLWEPWPADTPQSLVEMPTPVAEAPLSPAAFAQWLEATARHDMTSVLAAHRTSPEAVTKEQAVPVVTLAAGRAMDAWALAQAYGVDLEDSPAQLGTLIERAAQLKAHPSSAPATAWALSAEDLSSEWADLQAQESFSESLREALAASPEATAAVRTWDCVAQTLPHMDIAVAPVGDAELYADALLTRSTELLSKGATDERQLRCELEASNASSLAQQVVAADIALALSSSEYVSALGVELLLADVQQWRSVLSSADVAALLAR
ncbi:hypothetical protein [Schaalia sp. Marseille-Q2122]|uniref:hypothetical protein n=1 Tax=Schaalia sp. Marseille-Q2122 TaxID=2736604 RepID=UPI00158AD4E7|nr:hypothetical protein [Schaalia sp. Marseille-Q2122]